MGSLSAAGSLLLPVRLRGIQLGRPIDVMSGPATDNDVGERYVEDELRIPAANARTRGAKLAEIVEAKLFPK